MILFRTEYGLTSFRILEFLLPISLLFHHSKFHLTIKGKHIMGFRKMFNALFILFMLTIQNHIFLPFHSKALYFMVLNLCALFFIDEVRKLLSRLISKLFSLNFRLFYPFFAWIDINFLHNKVIITNIHFLCRQRLHTSLLC